MLSNGELLPNTLIADIPTQINGYAPKNYNLTYDGAVTAKKALARSLNIPAVMSLKKHGIGRLLYTLNHIGLNTINKSADYYGLSLILGGAESNLWEITGAYASMARTLNHYSNFNSMYNKNDFSPPKYLTESEISKNKNQELSENSYLDAGAIWLTFNAMLDVERPTNEGEWKYFSSEQKIAWKTGTSFGYKDGWAVGITPKYVVGVWVGNADGEGRPNLTGINTAGPILFDIFDFLPQPENWFYKPYDDMIKIAVCKKSGCLPSSI